MLRGDVGNDKPTRHSQANDSVKKSGEFKKVIFALNPIDRANVSCKHVFDAKTYAQMSFLILFRIDLLNRYNDIQISMLLTYFRPDFKTWLSF